MPVARSIEGVSGRNVSFSHNNGIEIDTIQPLDSIGKGGLLLARMVRGKGIGWFDCRMNPTGAGASWRQRIR